MMGNIGTQAINQCLYAGVPGSGTILARLLETAMRPSKTVTILLPAATLPGRPAAR